MIKLNVKCKKRKFKKIPNNEMLHVAIQHFYVLCCEKFTVIAGLTLYGPNSFFRRFSGHNLRWALFVYRLIGATLIGNFFDDPFLK